jgi:lipoprotein-anchoring transpeptidase ErfK/SrfK
MPTLSRRSLLLSLSAAGATLGLAACTTDNTPGSTSNVSSGWRMTKPGSYPQNFQRAEVRFLTDEPAGTIIVDPTMHYLYLVQGAGRARRYGIGVGGEGYGWSGVATVENKQEWPNWYPTRDILQRQPQLVTKLSRLEGGDGFPGGPENPLGARALYLWQDHKDTLYRIHGTNEPWSIGHNVSSGCIRMTNDDVIDLYTRVPVGTKVVVLPTRA